VVHCHPSLANAYFSVNRKLKNLTFEAKFYLGDVPVVRQKTLTVTEPGPVIEALKASGIVVVKNHGVFSRGKDAESALERVAILEEACRIHAFACLFRNSKPGPLDTELKQYLRRRA
jgi:ribulose-5-phosphate 4-epimerase/fuculose-1-phosphate aldolase